MIQAWVPQQVTDRTSHACLIIERPEDDAIEAGKNNGTGAHGARLERDE
jgi:hypothetical protein